MAGISVFAHRLEIRTWVVCPDICWLHTIVAVLAICNGISGQTIHEIHLPHSATWVLNKPVLRGQRQNQA